MPRKQAPSANAQLAVVLEPVAEIAETIVKVRGGKVPGLRIRTLAGDLITHGKLLEGLGKKTAVEIQVQEKRPEWVSCLDCKVLLQANTAAPIPVQRCVECNRKRAVQRAKAHCRNAKERDPEGFAEIARNRRRKYLASHREEEAAMSRDRYNSNLDKSRARQNECKRLLVKKRHETTKSSCEDCKVEVRVHENGHLPKRCAECQTARTRSLAAERVRKMRAARKSID